ncbi:MAG: outer membrane beta-barrel protein [Pseudomonadota bacterium]
MKLNKSVPVMIGLLSVTAMLGACSMSQPYGGHHSSGWSSGGSYSAGYSGSAYATAPSTKTYYAPRIDAGYTGRATTISSSAPYGASTTYYGGGYGAHRGLRPAGYTYGSIGLNMYDVDAEEALGVQGRLGYQFSPLLGVEAEGSYGITDDGGFDPDYQIAGFGVAKLPLGPRLSAHARGGYHNSDLGAGDDDGFAYGAGAEYRLNARDSLRFDYTNYEVTGANLDSVSLAFQRRF